MLYSYWIFFLFVLLARVATTTTSATSSSDDALIAFNEWYASHDAANAIAASRSLLHGTGLRATRAVAPHDTVLDLPLEVGETRRRCLLAPTQRAPY